MYLTIRIVGTSGKSGIRVFIIRIIVTRIGITGIRATKTGIMAIDITGIRVMGIGTVRISIIRIAIKESYEYEAKLLLLKSCIEGLYQLVCVQKISHIVSNF